MTATKCIALLLLAMAVAGTQFNVIIDGNGGKFDSDVGKRDAQTSLFLAAEYFWYTFDQQSPTDRKNVSTINLHVSPVIRSITYVEGSDIYLSTQYVNTFPGNASDVSYEVTGIILQGVADILQWDANGAAPKWWHGAIPSYFRLFTGFLYSNFAKPGSGSTWEHGVDITARFIEYLDTVTPGFVAKMNAKIRTSWDLGYFNDITAGRSIVDQAKVKGAQVGRAIKVQRRQDRSEFKGGRIVNQHRFKQHASRQQSTEYGVE